MNYFKVKKEFSAFDIDADNVNGKNVKSLLRELKKITQLEQYYNKKRINSKYFYDLWHFFAAKKIDLELALGIMAKQNWDIRQKNEQELRKERGIK